MKRQIVEMSVEDFELLTQDELPGWEHMEDKLENVQLEDDCYTSILVAERKSDGKYFQAEYTVPFNLNGETIEMKEVFPATIKITVYN